MSRLKLVVFDLDDTVWYPEMYMLYGGPFKKDKEGKVFDKRGTEIKFIPGAEKTLVQLMREHPEVKIGWASRTDYPEWAFECLKLFTVNGKRLFDLGEFHEVYPGDKKSHFRRFKKDSGFEYEEMLFFDNENRNCVSVSQLGVKCVYTPNGMTFEYWEQGLRHFQ